MRARLYLALLSTLTYINQAISLPSEVQFYAAQAHESVLIPTSNTLQTVFTPSTSSGTHKLRTRTQTVHQPRFVQDIYRARERSLKYQQSEPIEWVKKEVLAPDVTDRITLQELAKMTANAYAKRGAPNWYNMTMRWNTVREMMCGC
jgi:putative lipase involved disintegration of autophagic bodies